MGNAQVVRGRLLDASDGTSLGTAMITLVDRNDREAGRVLTRSNSGLFQLEAPAPGEYRLRAERIGYASTHSDAFNLAVGDTLVLEMNARVQAISLRGIEAIADRRCRVRPGEGLAVTSVWEEARKALEAAAWTQERGLYEYDMLRIKRRLDRTGRRVESEDRVYARGFSEAPYVSLSADSLLTGGFARYSPGESVFWAPDAEVLLSDDFLDTHCFRIRQGRDAMAGVVGLDFEPVPDRSATDISGTIWLDEATSRLSWLDFQYENLNAPPSLLDADPGGRVDFHTLPNGTWIVTSWHLRMFRARVATTDSPALPTAATLDGITLEHGEVLRVHGDEGVVFEGDAGGRIVGTVLDSAGVGLPGARVFIEGSGAEVVTDVEGRFELTHLGPGTYVVYFTHPYLQQLAHQPEPTEVRIREGAATAARANFEAPGMEQLINDVCDGVTKPTTPLFFGESLLWREAILTGRVTDEAGMPVDGMSVRVYTMAREFGSLLETGALLDDGTWRDLAVARTDASGFYGACWLPANVTVMLALLDEGEELDPNDVGQVLNLANLFPGSIRLVTLPAGAPYQLLNIRIESR